ncbi:serine/threonine-protein kinase, partial [Acidobacteria bacterium AH-259-O06]|nr:serine/threonine-protein kinase [Acidobacteria bacterium AH-259-O06]
LVLELVEGETLAERLTRGPLPVEEALEVCRQIAEGVEAAHEKGVIHRDLKPTNVKITPEGNVKVLDFGLAKALEGEIPAADISHSPTLTHEMTSAGVILGTAAYMSPEQAKGKLVDKRADVWAFGCVLYELLTGKRAFEGETITETIAAVLKGEPDWEALSENIPWNIRTLLRRCLQKDTRRRLQHTGDVRIEIEEALTEPTTASPVGVIGAVQPPLWRRAIPWSITAVTVIVAAGLAFWSLTRPERPSLTKFVITPPPTAPLVNAAGNELAISPDGRRIVYLAERDGTRQLYVRPIDDLMAAPIPGTEGASGGPFFSPDGGSVVFVADGKLKKVSLLGGPAMTLCEVSQLRGGSWNPEDTIVFAAASEGGFSLYRVSAAGGEPESLAITDPTKGESRYRFPEILPGGDTVLFTIGLGAGINQIAVLSLQTSEHKIVLEAGRQAHYVPTGHLVYATETGTLMAVPFDLARLELTGDPVPILEGVRATAEIDYAFSGDGTLVYVPGAGQENKGTLVWVDRDGRVEPLVEEPLENPRYPRLSPDGRRLALTTGQLGAGDLWVYDLAGRLLLLRS